MTSFASTGKKIVAIGRNYAKHARELGNAIPEKPFFFLKPTTSYVHSPEKIEIPRGTIVHHEIELGVVIGHRGRDIQAANAESHISGYVLAIDMTARNMQDAAKKKGLPWSAAKGFDTFTPIGSFIPKSSIADPHNLSIWLKINNEFKQNGTTSDMMFRIPQLLEHVSSIMTLEVGDVILTGTPEGVGKISAGDKITAGLASPTSSEQIATINFDVIDREGGYVFSE